MSKEIVEQVLADHADLIVVPNGEKFEDRRRSLLVPVIDALDGGRARYGILKKSGGVPSDIIVDLNFDHIDVFSGTELGNGTSRITATWTNYGDFRRPDRKWRRATVQEALDEGWIDPLDDDAPPSPPAPETHRYVGGGNDTGTCDQCGQPRDAAVHAVPGAKVPHPYDGGEHDTGVCDLCGQTSAAAIHQTTAPPSGDHEQRITALEQRCDRHIAK